MPCTKYRFRIRVDKNTAVYDETGDMVMQREPKDYIIFPLDVPDYDQAMVYVDKLSEHIGLFKVGLELFASQGPAIINAIRDAGPAEVFLDLKLHDIPATVRRAFSVACNYGVRFVTIHCDAGQRALEMATEASTGNTQILAVTVLTSMGPDSLLALGYDPQYARDIQRLVLLRAQLAKRAGCHGIVCSGEEVSSLRSVLGPDLVMVTPGIRPSWSVVGEDDQRRIVTPAEAIKSGADYIVIGRPIRDAASPQDAAKKVTEEIAKALG